MFRIYAHRCAPREYPGNTIESAKQAIEDGAHGFECDVMLTRDKEPVIIHPLRYNRYEIPTVDTDRTIDALTWKQLSNIGLRSGHRIPHLDDVLSLVASTGTRCYIEPKAASRELVEIVAGIIAEDRLVMSKCTMLTFAGRSYLLKWSKEAAPSLNTNAIVLNPFRDLDRAAALCSADEITLGWKWWNHFRFLDLIGWCELCDLVQHTRVQLMAGFADTRADIEWLRRSGVKYIFTNNVDLAARMLR